MGAIKEAAKKPEEKYRFFISGILRAVHKLGETVLNFGNPF